VILPENSLLFHRAKGEYVALPNAYLRSAKHLPAILNAIQTAKAPSQFNQRFLKSLDFRSPSDRRVIGVLKALKFISDDGAPTERYHLFLDYTQAPGVLADGIRDAYTDLFQLDANAQDLTKGELIDKFRTLNNGQLPDSVINEMTMTFGELCKLAHFRKLPSKQEERRLDEEGAPDGKIEDKQAENSWKTVRVDGLAYRVEVVSPESRDAGDSRTATKLLLMGFLVMIFVVADLFGVFNVFGTSVRKLIEH
jgi:uncharacterized protein DUF5343